MRIRSTIALATWSLLVATTGAQPAGDPSPADLRQGTAIMAPAAPAQAMQKLQSSADHLRRSVQALAQKEPGLARDHAIAKAKEALLQTQQAMLALPPNERAAPATKAGYEASVRELVRSADSLHSAIQVMTREAGEGRSQAIAQANQALWTT